jgi:hypothetical protein
MAEVVGFPLSRKTGCVSTFGVLVAPAGAFASMALVAPSREEHAVET